MMTSAPMPPWEGIGHYVWNLSRFLVRQGHSVQIITRGRLKRTHCETSEGITIWRPTFAPIYPWHVHLHSLFVNPLVTRIAPGVDVFHVHSPLPAVIKTKRPILLTVHSPMRAATRSLTLRSFTALLSRLQTPVSYQIERQLLNQAARVTVVAASVAGDLREYGIDPVHVEVVGNGVDVESFGPGQPRPESPTYIVAAGRLAMGKGFEDLIECMRLVIVKLPNLRCQIAGSGPLENALRAQIARAGLDDHVELLGHVRDRQQMAALYQRAAVFVHPAHYEGLPTVILEAMACGRPVVATAVSGALDVIQPGENGLLVPPRNPSEMAATVLRLLSDPGLAERLGRAARRTVEERYSWEKVGAHYLQLYGQLTSPPTSPSPLRSAEVHAPERR